MIVVEIFWGDKITEVVSFEFDLVWIEEGELNFHCCYCLGLIVAGVFLPDLKGSIGPVGTGEGDEEGDG